MQFRLKVLNKCSAKINNCTLKLHEERIIYKQNNWTKKDQVFMNDKHVIVEAQ